MIKNIVNGMSDANLSRIDIFLFLACQWIETEDCTGLHGPWRTKPTDFGDSLYLLYNITNKGHILGCCDSTDPLTFPKGEL